MQKTLTNKKTILLFVLIGVLLSNVGCNNHNHGPLETKTTYKAYPSKHILFPAAVGSRWIYNRYTIEHFGNEDKDWTYSNFSSFGINTDTLKTSLEVYQSEIMDSVSILLNDTLYSSVIFNKGLKVPYFVGSNGVYNMGFCPDGEDPIFKKGLYLPKDIPLNKPWNGQISFVQEGKYNVQNVFDRRCLSYNEVIKTPAGTFECYVIRTRIIEAEDYPGYSDFYEYFAPNIGLVAQVHIFILPNAYWSMRYISLLKTYHLTNRGPL